MQIRANDEATTLFEQAYDEYADAIFRHCYFHCFKREEAKDMMQEAFVKTWEYIADGNEIDNVRAFLYRVATNLLINAGRKKKQVSLDELQEQGFDPAGDDDTWQNRDVIKEEKAMDALQQLEEPYREAITMRYIEGLEPHEIAEAIGESPNTVSVRVHRGLKQLKSLLHDG